VASIAGIGFTVSLFVTELGYSSEELVSDAKLGVLFASLVSALVGSVLVVAARGRAKEAVPTARALEADQVV
jgi:Na+/H+ antiporter NhaA